MRKREKTKREREQHGIERGIKSESKSKRESERERGGEITERDGAEKEPSEAILSLDS